MLNLSPFFACLAPPCVPQAPPLRRLYGQDFVVDESMWHGHVANGRPFLMDGNSGKVSFRLLHVFEVQDGKITSEQVWCDLAALQRQLGATPTS